MADTQVFIQRIESDYAPDTQPRDDMDDLSQDLGAWHLNMRYSNTEPMPGLDLEARGHRGLLNSQLARLRGPIDG
ncbi:hypothetical protein [Roseinatronobacter ekhonensis]|uniref:hypothetical protein n=1 Tax=Roseinatronobacter ekhonensis TaxID=254356 RepID=UPI0011C493A2|nr:hypothetical protein [Roseibaca ekhonensis]